MFQKKSNVAPHQDTICIIGHDAKIEGNLTASQALRIDGTVIGNIETNDKILVTSSAKVIGEIKANQATIDGAVEGPIDCKELSILKDAIITGDITYSTIHIETGAQIDGQLNLNKNVVELKEVKRITAS